MRTGRNSVSAFLFLWTTIAWASATPAQCPDRTLIGARTEDSCDERSPSSPTQTNLRSGESVSKKRAALTFKDLRFPIESVDKVTSSQIPDRIRKFVGRDVRIRGYMSSDALTSQSGIGEFVLVRDNREYFPWPMHDNVLVRMTAGRTARFTTRPVTVRGRFHVIDQTTVRGGRLPVVFEIRCANIEY